MTINTDYASAAEAAAEVAHIARIKAYYAARAAYVAKDTARVEAEYADRAAARAAKLAN